MNTKCDAYWAYADEIPLAEVVAYWCEKSGFPHEHCRAAKRSAIVAACKSGVIKYGRSDGKSFIDPPDMLAGINVLTIDRKSFDTWVMENFEDTSPIPDKAITPRERNTYQNIIGGLLGLMLGKTPAGKSQSVFENQSMVIAAMLGNYPGKPGVSDSNLEKYFAEANRSIKSS